jgi:hypothetical protein
MKMTITLLSLFLSFMTIAQVEYLTPSGLKASLEGVEFVNLRYREFDYDETTKVTYLTYAEVEIKLKITDNGCRLSEESTIFVNYKGDDPFSDSTKRKHELELYLSSNSPNRSACAGQRGGVSKIESLKFQLVNGLGSNIEDDVVHTFVINSNAGWNAKPVEVKLLVNQRNQIVKKL